MEEGGQKGEPDLPKLSEGDFEATVRGDYYIEYQEFKAIKDRPDVLVLDARPIAFYEGQGPWHQAGPHPRRDKLPLG